MIAVITIIPGSLFEYLWSCYRLCSGFACETLNHTIFSHLYINFSRNDLHFNEFKGNVDFLVISETKLDNIFPKVHLRILGLPPFW